MINLHKLIKNAKETDPDALLFYACIHNAALKAIGEVEGALLEIGTCDGGSAGFLLAAMSRGAPDRHLVTVDPWGGKPYEGSNLYTNVNQMFAQKELADLSYEHCLKWTHYKMESLEFFEHVQPLGMWYDGEKADNLWAFVLLDGEHNQETVLKELDAVCKFVSHGGTIIIDNSNQENGLENAITDWAKRNDAGHEVHKFSENIGGNAVQISIR